MSMFTRGGEGAVIAKRPLMVWAIAIFFVLHLAHFALSYARGYALLRDGTRIPLKNSPADKATRVTVAAIGCIAAVQLFRLRRSAAPLFLLAAVGVTAITTHDIVRVAPSRHAAFAIVALMVWPAIYLFSFGYASWLRSRGALGGRQEDGRRSPWS